MSRDFIASQKGREFRQSPARDRIVRGTGIELTVGIYQVEISTSSPNLFSPYPLFDLGANIYSRAVSEASRLAGIPYPALPGKDTYHLNLATGAEQKVSTTSQPLVIINSAGVVLRELFLAFSVMEVFSSQSSISSPIGSALIIRKTKIVFNRPTFSPFCISQQNAYLTIQPNGLVGAFAHDSECYKSRVTSGQGVDSDPDNMYLSNPDARSIEFGPNVPDESEVPAIAMEQILSRTANGVGLFGSGFGNPGGYFSTQRKIAGVFYDATGTKKILRTPGLGFGDTDTPLPCCDLS